MLTPAERRLRAQIAANTRWSRGGHAEQGRKLQDARFARYERQVDPDGILDTSERAKRAQSALKADMQRLALKSAHARRARRK